MNTLPVPARVPPAQPSAVAPGLFRRISDIPIWHAFGALVLFLAAGFNLVSLDNDKETVALDSQVLLKLFIVGAAGLYGILGFVIDSRVRSAAWSFPTACIWIIVALYFLASISTVHPASGIVSTMSVLAVFLMTLTALSSLGQLTTLRILFVASSVFVLVSWILYLFVPSIGVLAEPIDDGEFMIRMSGLAHPNTLGQFSAICCLLGLTLYFAYQQKNLAIPIINLLALAAMYFCFSRNAILSLSIALLFGFRSRIFSSRRVVQWSTTIATIGFVLVMIASTQFDIATVFNEKARLLTKSGDTEEILSATGRGEIWSHTVQLIREKPVLGYGPTSSKHLLEDYSFYTHNMLLNIALSCGVGGLLVALLMFLGRIKMLFSHRSVAADTIFVFILFNGIFENVVFSNISGLPTICLVVGLVWFQFDSSSSEGSDE